MIVDIVPISTLDFRKVRYYTVLYEGHDMPEFQDFQQRMHILEKDRFEVREINRHIEIIGKKYGAYSKHFRDEDAAEGLPPPYHQFVDSGDFNDFGLRLYCIRLSPSVVILLNGDRKTSLKVKDCDNCRPHFNKAVAVAKRIDQAILDEYLEIDDENREIIIDNDFILSI